MLQAVNTPTTPRYARAIEAPKRIRWEIERDVIRGRRFDFSRNFLPAGLSRVNALTFLDGGERRLLSQIQGRSYVNIFGLIERFIAAKVMEVSRDHWLSDQVAPCRHRRSARRRRPARRFRGDLRLAASRCCALRRRLVGAGRTQAQGPCGVRGAFRRPRTRRAIPGADDPRPPAGRHTLAAAMAG